MLYINVTMLPNKEPDVSWHGMESNKEENWWAVKSQWTQPTSWQQQATAYWILSFTHLLCVALLLNPHKPLVLFFFFFVVFLLLVIIICIIFWKRFILISMNVYMCFSSISERLSMAVVLISTIFIYLFILYR